MSRHKPVRSIWSKWFEADGMLAFLYGGFRQYRQEESEQDDSGFVESQITLGMGLAHVFHII